jgi:CCR4-NOT complex subunit CAF16
MVVPDRRSSTLAGKSTLLQILAGKRLVKSNGAQILINGRDVFRDTPPGIVHLGTEWKVILAIKSRADTS